MGIENRTLDPQQKNEVYTFSQTFAGVTAIVTGATYTLGIVPYPSNLMGAQIAAWGTSGSPSLQLNVNRFIAGTGFTSIIVGTGTSNVVAEFGTSGAGSFGTSLFGSSGMLLLAQGNSLMQLLANDLLVLTTGGSNSACKSLAVSVAIQPIQDIKYRFGTGI